MIKRILVTILGLLAVTAAGLRAANSDQQQTNPWTVGTWAPPTGLTQVPIWPSRAPDMTGAPEAAETISKYGRSEEHTSELQSLMRISYAVFCLKTKNTNKQKIR